MTWLAGQSLLRRKSSLPGSSQKAEKIPKMGPTALRQEGQIEVTDPTVTPKETFQNPVLDHRREETWRDSAAGWLSCTLSRAPREH